MQIAKEDLPYLDIIWFAVDKFHRIIEFTSLGCGVLPDFIHGSAENVEFLEKYFFDEYKPFTEIKYYYD